MDIKKQIKKAGLLITITLMFLILIQSTIGTEYNNWKENDTEVWIKANLTASTEYTFYINEGNTTTDCDNIFLFCNDFEDSSTSQWSGTATTSIDTGTVHAGTKSMKVTGSAYSKATFYESVNPTDSIMEIDHHYINDNDHYFGMGSSETPDDFNRYMYQQEAAYTDYRIRTTQYSSGGGWASSGVTDCPISTWCKLKVFIDDNKITKVVTPGGNLTSFPNVAFSDVGGLDFGSGNWGTGHYFDNYFMREYDPTATITVNCTDNVCTVESDKNLTDYQLKLITDLTGDVEVADEAITNYTIGLTINKPTTSQYFNTNPITFNYTVDPILTLGNLTCISTYNNQTRTDYNISNTTSFQWTDTNTINTEETKTFFVNCTDITDGAPEKTRTRTYYYDDIAPRINSTYNTSTTQLDQIWINNTFTDLSMSTTYTQLENKYNETNTSLTGNFNYTKNLDITQYGIGTYNVTGNATDQAGNSINYTTSFTINPDGNYLIIRAMDYLGITPLALATIYENHTSTTQISNPFQNPITNYLNKENWNISIFTNISDYESKHIDTNTTFSLTRHNWEHNITLNPSQLILNFYQDGTQYNAKGFVADTQPKRYDFNESQIVIIQQELANGYVYTRFGDNSSGNWTQYYEYINDETEHINEDLEVLQNADWSIHVQALDNAKSPLLDVIVRAQYMEYSLNQWTNATLLGQRLTTDDGLTFFIADSSSQLLLTFTKTGYSPVDVPITVGDESFTRADPLTIYMTKSETGVEDNIWISPIKDIHNDTEELYLLILAVGRDRVQYQTNHMITQGLDAQDITPSCDTLDRCQVTLAEGTHFLNTQSEVIHIYVDNEYWGNRTIPLDDTDYNEIFERPNVNSTILAPLLLVGLLILIAGMTIRFRSRNVGIGTWTAGIIVISLIEPVYWALAFITFAGIAFKWIWDMIKE